LVDLADIQAAYYMVAATGARSYENVFRNSDVLAASH
jgi:hypothetical protein